MAEMVEWVCEHGHTVEIRVGGGPPPLPCLIRGCDSTDWTEA